MKSITVTVETDDPICPKAKCIVFTDRSVFIPYSIISSIHCRTKPPARSVNKNIVYIDSYIKYYSVLESDRQILATLNRIKERALTQLENQNY